MKPSVPASPPLFRMNAAGAARALPSLRQLRYLVTLSEMHNFTRAAQACFVTQSTLSAGLKELESALGARLVERDRQSVRMTPAGEMVVERARPLLAGATDLMLAAAALQSMAGTVRLGVIPTIAPFLLPAILPGLRAAHPQLRIALREDLTANLLARLDDGELDFALIALPYETEHLLVRALFDDELWLLAPKDEPLLAQDRPVQITQRVAGRLLLLEEGHCLREHTLQACRRLPPGDASEIEATSLLTLVQMVEAGLGLALLPEIAVRAGMLAASALVARPLASPAPHRTIALVARRSTARAQEFEAIATHVEEAHREQRRRSLRAPIRRTPRPKPSA